MDTDQSSASESLPSTFGGDLQCPQCHQSDKVTPLPASGIAPPIKPAKHPMYSLLRGVQGLILGLGGFMVLCNLGSMLLAAISRDTIGVGFGVLGGFGMLACLLPSLAIPIVIVEFALRSAKRTYEVQFDQWTRASSKWDSLFYCSRCAGVFARDQTRLVPVEQLQSFLGADVSLGPIIPQ